MLKKIIVQLFRELNQAELSRGFDLGQQFINVFMEMRSIFFVVDWVAKLLV